MYSQSSYSPRTPRINLHDLVAVTVAGQVCHPAVGPNPYRIGHDGVPRVLPGTGGIALNQRIGDRCVGLAGDHIEPGVSIQNFERPLHGAPDGFNVALMTLACVGNLAVVTNGPCAGARGMVTGKHAGVDHLLLDFPKPVLQRLRIGDRIQVQSMGVGTRLMDYPDITVLNTSPQLISHWRMQEREDGLLVPVTHIVPSAIMGSGLGKNMAWRGDYDIQLADENVRRRFKLGSLRYGDLVAIAHADNRFGPIYHQRHVTIGVIVHSDSTVSGHGPGVTPLLTGPVRVLRPIIDARANLAALFSLRPLAVQRQYRPLAGPHARKPRVARGRTVELVA